MPAASVPDSKSMATNRLGADRRARIDAARLYLVCDRLPGDRGLEDLLPAAIFGGVDVVQLRDKQLDDDGFLAEAAAVAADVCKEHGALFVLNDRPDIAAKVRADGVHVGQDDMPVAQAREIVGPDMLIGLSTHSPEQIDAEDAQLADYIGVGPVHETPTKPGRAAVGLELVRYAAAHATRPFFAIGGLHAGNLAATLDAGAQRAVVLRAIAEADDPERAARALRKLLDERPPEP
ncbi:MAG: thiamine phosphate synthase [Solirubrobacterales bacterium]